MSNNSYDYIKLTRSSVFNSHILQYICVIYDWISFLHLSYAAVLHSLLGLRFCCSAGKSAWKQKYSSNNYKFKTKIHNFISVGFLHHWNQKKSHSGQIKYKKT